MKGWLRRMGWVGLLAGGALAVSCSGGGERQGGGTTAPRTARVQPYSESGSYGPEKLGAGLGTSLADSYKVASPQGTGGGGRATDPGTRGQ